MIALTITGLDIDTFDDALEAWVVDLQTNLSLTAAQADRIRTDLRSSLGQIARTNAEREVQLHEAIAAVYATLTLETSGAALDRVVRLIGVTRRAAENSRVLGRVVGGTPALAVPDGTRIRYNPTGAVFLTDGAVVLDGSGEFDDLPLVAETDAAISVALDPDTGFDDWTLLDVLVGFGSFESTEQPIVGHPIETDAALRTRARTEAFRRGTGPLTAIDAAVADVTGVTYVHTYENRTLVTDADGIPGKAINVVVEGGSDLAIAEAIWASRSAGAEMHGAVAQDIVDAYGFTQTVHFDRVDTVRIYVRATITTSTSEESAPADLATVIATLISDGATATFGIGDDILPVRIAALIANVPGIDDIIIRTSLDGVSYSTLKRTISIRERPTFAFADVLVVEM